MFGPATGPRFVLVVVAADLHGRLQRFGRGIGLDPLLGKQRTLGKVEVFEAADRNLVLRIVVGPTRKIAPLRVDAVDAQHRARRTVLRDRLHGELRITARAHRIDTRIGGVLGLVVVGDHHRTVETDVVPVVGPIVPRTELRVAPVGHDPARIGILVGAVLDRGGRLLHTVVVLIRNTGIADLHILETHQTAEVVLAQLRVGFGSDFEDIRLLEGRLFAGEDVERRHLRVVEVRIGVELVPAGRVVTVRRRAADRKHHAVVAQIEPVEAHVHPLADHVLQIEVEIHEQAAVKLQLDGGRAVVDVERLVDIALPVAADHLALDVEVRGFGPFVQPLEVLLVGRLRAELQRPGRCEVAVRTRTRQAPALGLEHLLDLFDRHMLQSQHRHILVGKEFLGSRSVEVVVAPRGKHADRKSQ